MPSIFLNQLHLFQLFEKLGVFLGFLIDSKVFCSCQCTRLFHWYPLMHSILVHWVLCVPNPMALTPRFLDLGSLLKLNTFAYRSVGFLQPSRLHPLLIPLMTQRTINSSHIADVFATILVIAIAAMTGASAVGVDITNPNPQQNHEDARRTNR